MSDGGKRRSTRPGRRRDSLVFPAKGGGYSIKGIYFATRKKGGNWSKKAVRLAGRGESSNTRLRRRVGEVSRRKRSGGEAGACSKASPARGSSTYEKFIYLCKTEKAQTDCRVASIRRAIPGKIPFGERLWVTLTSDLYHIGGERVENSFSEKKKEDLAHREALMVSLQCEGAGKKLKAAGETPCCRFGTRGSRGSGRKKTRMTAKNLVPPVAAGRQKGSSRRKRESTDEDAGLWLRF